MLIAGLTACSDDYKSAKTSSDNRVQLALSEPILLALQDADPNLVIEVIVDGNTADPIRLVDLKIDTETNELTGRMNIELPAGEHSLELVYYIDDPEFGLVRIAETDAIAVSVVAGQTSDADFTSAAFRYLDNDNDGFYDTTEIQKRTNPADNASMPVPEKPAGVVLEVSSGTVKIQWGAVEGASSYTIFWGTSSDISTQSSRIDNAGNPYQHEGLNDGTEYFYRVMASNIAGDSELSDVVSAVPVAGGGSGSGSWDNSQWDNAQWGQ